VSGLPRRPRVVRERGARRLPISRAAAVGLAILIVAGAVVGTWVGNEIGRRLVLARGRSTAVELLALLALLGGGAIGAAVGALIWSRVAALDDRRQG
jgi:hypothetical protein